jgi:hypothetical protein
MPNPCPESVPCEASAMAEDLVRALRALEGDRALADLRRALREFDLDAATMLAISSRVVELQEQTETLDAA